MKIVFLALIKFYQIAISPLIAPRCRYIPTCSQYSLEAIQSFGAIKGSYLAINRICRCHPWGGVGYDPIPINLKKLCYFYLSVEKPYFIIPFNVRFYLDYIF